MRGMVSFLEIAFVPFGSKGGLLKVDSRWGVFGGREDANQVGRMKAKVWWNEHETVVPVGRPNPTPTQSPVCLVA